MKKKEKSQIERDRELNKRTAKSQQRKQGIRHQSSIDTNIGSHGDLNKTFVETKAGRVRKESNR
jgi:hypothetical protein